MWPGVVVGLRSPSSPGPRSVGSGSSVLVALHPPRLSVVFSRPVVLVGLVLGSGGPVGSPGGPHGPRRPFGSSCWLWGSQSTVGSPGSVLVHSAVLGLLLSALGAPKALKWVLGGPK